MFKVLVCFVASEEIIAMSNVIKIIRIKYTS